jgi:integrase
MRKNKAENSSKHYPELHKYERSPYWVFRKFSKEKRKEFVKSTGLIAIENNAAKAYKVGRKHFDEWLNTSLITSRSLTMGNLLQTILLSKKRTKNGEKGNTYRSARNQINNHLIPAFGHLRPDQITQFLWETYDGQERLKVKITKHGKTIRRTKLFNTRKYLLEALRLAKSSGFIKEIPEIKDFDGDAKPAKTLDKQTIRKILKLQLRQSKFFFFLLWKQGPRPEEALQYEWDMIDWNLGDYGYLNIPGRITKTGRSRNIPLNSRVSRVLRRLEKGKKSRFIFPSRYIEGDRQRNYRKGWESACKALGIDADPYNLRDTFITSQIVKGINTSRIAKYVDSSAAMIEKRYLSESPDTMQEVVE